MLELSPIGLTGSGQAHAEMASAAPAQCCFRHGHDRGFCTKSKGLDIEKNILFISSGAGRKPRQAWSTYCSTKAALDMYAGCVAKEQRFADFPASIVSIAPGVVDTDMQALIRAQRGNKCWTCHACADEGRRAALVSGRGRGAADEIPAWRKFREKVLVDLREGS
ncbi:MAG: SDR family NAD(P)-dependent oxidoreductase [Bacteroidia bacterium]